MKKSEDKNHSRRKFLSLGFLRSEEQQTDKIFGSNDDEMISMLTPDGKLVEVKKSVLAQSSERQKVGNQDILNWTKTQKKS